MNITDLVISAESSLLNRLETFFIKNSGGGRIPPSHDLDHHRRVWKYGRELLTGACEKSGSITPESVESLLIGCYMHDLGMCIDQGFRHGAGSVQFCLQFLNENHLSESRFPGLISAIEDHDRKEYRQNDSPDKIETILSVADDLDAFGYIGIYRYAEIYMARNIGSDLLGIRILENAGSRFNHFSLTFSAFPELVSRHRNRYQVLIDFYLNYNVENENAGLSDNNISGYRGIISVIRSDKESFLPKLMKNADLYKDDHIISSFMQNLASELSLSPEY